MRRKDFPLEGGAFSDLSPHPFHQGERVGVSPPGAGQPGVGMLALAALETEKRFRKIIGHEDLWMLKAALDEGELPSETPQTHLDKELVAA